MIKYGLYRTAILLSFFLGIFSSAPFILNASTIGAIEGIVRDRDTNRLLEGAEISVAGTRLRSVTDDDEYYMLPGIPTGIHEVTVTLEGYQSVTVMDRLITEKHTLRIDFLLESTIIELPARVIESQGEHLVDMDNTVSVHRIHRETVQSLPADSYRDLVTLQAGTVRLGNIADSEYGISVRGGRPEENTVYIDGIDVRRYQTDQNLFDVPEFGIQELDLYTGGYSAAYGGAQSGVIDIASREGGPGFSGGLRYETEDLNGSSWNYGYNRLQVALGGPVPQAEGLTFFLSSDVIGKGDSRPRSAGFRGTTEGLFEVAERYRNDPDIRQFLGYDLDTAAMLRAAESQNPSLPILNLSDLREERFGGEDFEGRLPGNRGDEFRFQGKLVYRATEKAKLTASFFEDRDQGILFDRSSIFFTEERNLGFVNRNRLGILGFDQELLEAPGKNVSLSLRVGLQRFEQHVGDLFAPYDSNSPRVENPGASMGYHDQAVLGNFMFRDIPIFAEDLFASDYSDGEVFGGVIQADNNRADNPFGIPVSFWDENEGLNDIIDNNVEDRRSLRVDLDARLGRSHRVRTGLELQHWQVDTYRSKLSTATYLDFYHVEPDLESFYVEDRLNYRDFTVDLGLRLDSFHAGTDYPSVFGDQDSERIQPERKTEVAPRIGVAHPVSDRMQVRGSYGMYNQVPQFSNLYESINTDVDRQGNTDAYFGNPDLDLRKTTAFEVGLTTLLTDDWLIDFAGYDREFDGDVSAVSTLQEGSTHILRIYANSRLGHARGLDVVLRRRFRNYFAAELAYSFVSSEVTIDITDGGHGGGDPYRFLPHQVSDSDQTHTVNAQWNLRLPKDFREGTIVGRCLGETGLFFTIQSKSYDFIEGFDKRHTGWQTMVNLRMTRDFSAWGFDYTVFADVRNLFNADNPVDASVSTNVGVSNGVYQTTGSPYTSWNTIQDALDYMGIATPDLYVSPEDRTPTDINGDGTRDDADRAEIIRRLDINGNGTVTVEEELAMAILAIGAFQDNPVYYDIPRLFRVGVEVRF